MSQRNMSSVTSFGVLNAGDFIESSELLEATSKLAKLANCF